MTIERAIEILDPEHRERYDGLEEVNEACRMGMEALRIVRDAGVEKLNVICVCLREIADSMKRGCGSPMHLAAVCDAATIAERLKRISHFGIEARSGSDVPFMPMVADRDKIQILSAKAGSESDVPSMPVFSDWDTIHRESGLLED